MAHARLGGPLRLLARRADTTRAAYCTVGSRHRIATSLTASVKSGTYKRYRPIVQDLAQKTTPPTNYMSRSTNPNVLRLATLDLRAAEQGIQSPHASREHQSPPSASEISPESLNGYTTAMQSPITGVEDPPKLWKGFTQDEGKLAVPRANQWSPTSSTAASWRQATANPRQRHFANQMANFVSFGFTSLLQERAVDHLETAQVSLETAEAAASVPSSPAQDVSAMPSPSERLAHRLNDVYQREGLQPCCASPERLDRASMVSNGTVTPRNDVEVVANAHSIRQANQAWKDFVDHLAHEIKLFNVVAAILIPYVVWLIISRKFIAHHSSTVRCCHFFRSTVTTAILSHTRWGWFLCCVAS